jgi:hypothetical protein
MNELMQQTLAGLPPHDRRLVREIRRLVDDARRIGAEMDVGEVKMMQARAAGGHAMGTARDLCGAARHAAYAGCWPGGGPSHTSPRTNSVQPLMRSRPHVLPRRKTRAIPQGDSSADASVTNSRRRFASSCSMTSSCGTTSCWSVFDY